MNLCLLADAASIHTQRWAEALADRHHRVTVLSLREAEIAGATVVNLAPNRRLGKPGYLTTSARVRSHVRELRPDLLHAHYATSYGLLGMLTGHHPFMISVWGSDIFVFPHLSPLHSALLRYVLRSADVIGSTSRRMKEETGRYTHKPINVTPFGVDTVRFTPRPQARGHATELTIGLIKALESNYGVPTLVEAFRKVAEVHGHVHLLIVGDGSQRTLIERMVRRTGLDSRVQLLPAVPHSQVPEVLSKIDIFVVPSLSESFGVAAVEASACGLPVVASRVGGLPEVVVDGETGLLVPPGDSPALANALDRLIGSEELRVRFGRNGRAFVEQLYSWDRCVDVMERVYASQVR